MVGQQCLFDLCTKTLSGKVIRIVGLQIEVCKLEFNRGIQGDCMKGQQCI